MAKVFQYYVMEIQQYEDGTYGDIKHFAYDENADQARMKGESKYYEVLAAAAVSNLPSHAAILFRLSGNAPVLQAHGYAGSA